MIVKSAEIECRGHMRKTEVRQPPIRAYMDDIGYGEQVDPTQPRKTDSMGEDEVPAC